MNAPSYGRALGALCVCTMVFILVAGLWPFHAPKNDVAWLAKENGLRFGAHGTVLGARAFEAPGSSSNSSGSLEIWLEPARSKDRKTMLAFADPGHTEAPFLLQQSGDALIVQRRNRDDEGNWRIAESIIQAALPKNRRLFVTITLGPHYTSVYLNGVLSKSSEILGTTPGTFTGRLVMGNSVTTSDSWSGQVFGLAIYEHELTAARVFEHYEDWTINHRPALTRAEKPAALYLFSERGGSVVHNQLDSSTDLNIPAQYLVLQSAFLSLPWRHYHPTWRYWEDVGINIVGFVPLGFFWGAYFSTVRAIRKASATTILLGFLTSLTIEWLQAYLPTRDSGMNDLITNTLGTVLGVLLYRSSLFQDLMAHVCVKQLPA
jgi:VanZ family protein